jgi:hypothetical protein
MKALPIFDCQLPIENLALILTIGNRKLAIGNEIGRV